LIGNDIKGGKSVRLEVVLNNLGKNWNCLHLIVLLLITLTSCTALRVAKPEMAGQPTPSEADRTILADTKWMLISYGSPNEQIQVIERAALTLEFVKEAQVRGFAGCNTFGANYSVSMDDEISITKVFSTRKACKEQNVMEQERQYLNALKSASRFEYSEDTLKLWYDEREGVLSFSRITR
jgi:heat shock protein HslJ